MTHEWKVQTDQIREEDFNKEDKEKSDKSRAADMCKLDGVQHKSVLRPQQRLRLSWSQG